MLDNGRVWCGLRLLAPRRLARSGPGRGLDGGGLKQGVVLAPAGRKAAPATDQIRAAPQPDMLSKDGHGMVYSAGAAA